MGVVKKGQEDEKSILGAMLMAFAGMFTLLSFASGAVRTFMMQGSSTLSDYEMSFVEEGRVVSYVQQSVV